MLIVLSEPSHLINQMRGKLDNDLLVANLIGFLTDNRTTLLIDESHRDLDDPVHVMNKFVGGLGSELKVGVLIFLMAGFILVQTPLPRWVSRIARKGLDRLLAEDEREPPTPEEVIDRVMMDHPDWNRKTLEGIVNDLEV